jgi:dipeptidyl aminopeptidase/acylaminoacyl peptidase
VPVSESDQIVDALRQAGREVRYLLFSDDGHQIVKRENSTALTAAMSEWLNRAFGATQSLVEQDVSHD